jgi:hypothetical protein
MKRSRLKRAARDVADQKSRWKSWIKPFTTPSRTETFA